MVQEGGERRDGDMAECGLCSAEYAEEEKEVSTEGRSLDVQGRGARGSWREGVVADKRPMDCE